MRSRRTNQSRRVPEMTAAPARDASGRTAFGKGSGCPSSDELLGFCVGHDAQAATSEAALTPLRRATLRRHLALCDFCAAEQQLLAAHASRRAKPQPSCAPAQMPVHLYALARALLARPSHHAAPLAEIMRASAAPQPPSMSEALTDA